MKLRRESALILNVLHSKRLIALIPRRLTERRVGIGERPPASFDIFSGLSA